MGIYWRVLKSLFSLFVSVFLLSACVKSSSEELPLFEEKMFVLGTIVEVSLYGESEQRSQKIFHDLLSDFKYMQTAWNPHKRGSLRRVNGLLPLNAVFTIGPTMQDMIEKSTRLSVQSEGMFNPAIGKLINLWNFTQDELPTGPPPDPGLIRAILKQKPEMTDLQVGPLTLETRNAAVSLDFGAYAKGYGVDKAIDYLKSIGVENAIVNAGGDLRAIGQKGKKPWRIGIRHPREPGIIAGIDIQRDESVFTSGDYERFYDYQGQRYHHIIDPHTGYPANLSASVTVLHKIAAVADAAATALFIAGPEGWQRIAKKMGVDQVMLIDKAGKIYLTAKMEDRLTFINPTALDVIVVE